MNRITFGIIALNAQPFLEYNLRALYPFAHQIIVVEGATRAAISLASPEGHSMDGTLEMLFRFRAEEDPKRKLLIVSANDESYEDGFWPEKKEMSQAYAKRTTGDWLWQVDSDEFYREEDMRTVIDLLKAKPTLAGVSFPFYEFWGGFDYIVTGLWYTQQFTEVARIFRWASGHRYVSHRPPTVADKNDRIQDSENGISGMEMKKLGVFLYHYSYVLPKQAEQKVGYYSHVDWTDAFRENKRWLSDKYYGLKDPLFIGEKGRWAWQWLERFDGDHPKAIAQLRRDIRNGKLDVELRPTEDIEKLLDNMWYQVGRVMARLFIGAVWNPWKKIKKYFQVDSQEQGIRL